MKNKSQQDNIRAPIPNRNKKEMFAVADRRLGGSRMNVSCSDGKSRLARITGRKKRKLNRIRNGDSLIISPWGIQDKIADIIYKYRNNQTLLLKNKNLLPEEIIIFLQGGLNYR